MSKPAFFRLLDAATRAELDRRLAASGFGDIRAHVAWLRGRGVATSKSALWRYAARLRDRADREAGLSPDHDADRLARIEGLCHDNAARLARIERAVCPADETRGKGDAA